MRKIRLSLPRAVCEHLGNGRAKIIVVPKTRHVDDIQGHSILVDVNGGKFGTTVTSVKTYSNVETALEEESPKSILAGCTIKQAIEFWRSHTPKHLREGPVVVFNTR